MTYSMGPPTSNSRWAVNRTPQELMFFVKPESESWMLPARVRETGSWSVNLRVFRCSTVKGNLRAFGGRFNSTNTKAVLGRRNRCLTSHFFATQCEKKVSDTDFWLLDFREDDDQRVQREGFDQYKAEQQGESDRRSRARIARHTFSGRRYRFRLRQTAKTGSDRHGKAGCEG